MKIATQIVDAVGNIINVSISDGYLGIEPVERETWMELQSESARELAAILTHFAETGELPGEGGG